MTQEYKFVITGKDATKRAFMSIRKNLGAVRTGINSTQVKVAALAGAAGLGALVARSLQSGDALAKMADRVGATTEGLAGLQLITELNGESAESLTKSLEKMRRGVGEADRGIGTAKDAFEELGISIEDIKDLSADEQFIKIGSAIGELTDKNKQATLASDIFGRSGIKLLNTFAQGEGAMRGSREEAERLGIALSRTDTAKLEAANDAMLRASKRTEGLGNQITIALAPIIEELANQFTKAGVSSEDMSEVIQKGMKIGATVVGTFADGIHGINIVLKLGEVAGRAWGATWLQIITKVQNGLFDFWNFTKTALLTPIKNVLELAAPLSSAARDALAGVNDALVDIKPPPGLQDTLDILNEGLRQSKEELNNLLLAEIPSQVIEGKLKEVFIAADAAAARIAEKARMNLENSQSGGGADSSIDPKDQEKIQARLDKLNESFLTEFEMLQQKYANEQLLLDEALMAKLISEDQFKTDQLRSEARFNKAKEDLEKRSSKARGSIVAGGLKSIATIAGAANKKLFKIQQAASLAQALVTLPAAIIESFKNAGGYPWGIPPAAAMAATGAKQIASIKSGSVGGGGGAPSIGSGGSATTPNINTTQQLPQLAANNQNGVVIQLEIAGDVYAQDSEQFTEKVVAAVSRFTDADGVFINGDSAQALELGLA